MIVNPWAGMRISRGWREGSHKNNPAIDYPLAKGTPIYSPAAGRVSLRNWGGSRAKGDPGNKVAVYLADGRSIHIAHLDSFAVAHGQHVEVGDLLGYSGNTGNVEPAPTRTDPGAGSHVHTFGLLANGARWNWILDADASPASSDSNPFTPSPEEDTMSKIRLRSAYFEGIPGEKKPVICIVNAVQHTYYTVPDRTQFEFIEGSLGPDVELVDIPGNQPYGLIVGFQRI